MPFIMDAMADSLERFVDDIFRDLTEDETMTLPDEDALVRGEQEGDRIGRYTLVERLGEGGFGIVWRAVQEKPVRRELALKIIKPGMDSREVIARFEQERQALAVMDHPGIAKVFDAGATALGRPYFVMEMVRGLAVTQCCRETAMPLEARLALFTEVCHAVQHAHQKGIIHRDLKPNNILVTESAGRLLPKVIDFGIAKATREAGLTDYTLVTRMDRLVGTPAYMSPEQSEPGMDIDTRADIYSLGVVLYELLTGEVPFPPSAEGKSQRSRDVPRPSTRIRSLTAEQLKKLGETLRIEGPKLIGLVKGDLDWIVMKALEPDRARRYDSANALADDLQAYLNHRPVSARPPTPGYLIKRFTQRNKLAVGAGVAIVVILVAGVTTSTLMYLSEKKSLAQSREVVRFLKDTLAQAGVLKSLGKDSSMIQEILQSTAERIGREMQNQPEVELPLRHVIGVTYEDLDDYPQAITQLKRALELAPLVYGGDHPEWAQILSDYASALENDDQRKAAEPYAMQALEMRQRLFGEDHPLTGASHALVAWMLMKAGRAAEGEAHARAAVILWRKHPEVEELGRAPVAMGAVLHHLKRHEESLAMNHEELATLRRLYGPEHPYIVCALDNLSVQLCRMKRFEEVESYAFEALRQGDKFFNGRSPYEDHIYDGLIKVAESRQDWDKQLEYARKAMTAAKRVYTPGHEYRRRSSKALTRVLMQRAERSLTIDAKQTVALLDEIRADGDLEVDAKANCVWLDCLQGAATGARKMILQSLETLRKKAKPDAENTRRIQVATQWLKNH